jgi:mono/diheme cytochrome c family protein
VVLSFAIARRFGFATLLLAAGFAQAEDKPAAAPTGPVSFYKDIRPIFQANCHGCHQPAKRNGEYEMTDFANLVKGGETEEAAIVPGDPSKSYLIEQIAILGGKAAMPKDKDALKETEIALIERWIKEGAKDDTPASAKNKYDMEHPPVYNLPPVITALDFSKDGKLLAVSGFHEVLLHPIGADGAMGEGPVARLVGMSERIESAVFSPDGTKLAVSGGSPGRLGEVQIWDIAEKKLTFSKPVAYDTIYGAAWTPDMKMITFGCNDNTLRGIDTTSGEQKLYMAAHNDWVQDSIVSANGQSVISVGRDMTVKMTDIATQRFLGNITTHTPGVLRGGMLAVDLRPNKDEVVAGCADGRAKLFALKVDAAPAGGGNPNQIREFEEMPGRIFDIRFTPDGSRFVAGSSLDGKGHVWVFETDSGKKLLALEGERGGIFSVAVSPDGKVIASGGFDGNVYLHSAETGKLIRSFVPVQVQQ